MKAINLKCEYLINPVGIDIARPKLMWICDGGIKQTAYEVQCLKGGELLWESGKTETPSMYCICGAALSGRDRITWKVRLYDETDAAGDWSEEAFFEMGLLNKTDWKARWIAGNYKVNKKKRYPVDCFRQTFDVNAFASARLYITACGLYEAHINGRRAGDFVLAPG
ncbi:MAG: alpha-L-rhamnosidase N-terminal domain-containing protein, partial [Parasporobacterium sp.]|nr:alpha-L-rhamnosidase N-terminal domain-containing protein [Parasporobacterium sp.]